MLPKVAVAGTVRVGSGWVSWKQCKFSLQPQLADGGDRWILLSSSSVWLILSLRGRQECTYTWKSRAPHMMYGSHTHFFKSNSLEGWVALSWTGRFHCHTIVCKSFELLQRLRGWRSPSVACTALTQDASSCQDMAELASKRRFGSFGVFVFVSQFCYSDKSTKFGHKLRCNQKLTWKFLQVVLQEVAVIDVWWRVSSCVKPTDTTSVLA